MPENLKNLFEKVALWAVLIIGFFMWMSFPDTVETETITQFDCTDNAIGMCLFGLSAALLSLIHDREKEMKN